jgi:hypothetical protein
MCPATTCDVYPYNHTAANTNTNAHTYPHPNAFSLTYADAYADTNPSTAIAC